MKCYLTIRNIKYQKVHRNIFFYFNDIYHLTPPSYGDIKPQGFFASTLFFILIWHFLFSRKTSRYKGEL